MKKTKKISSLGILDIILNLELSQKEANKFNININQYKSIQDLKYLFQSNNNSSNQYNFNIIDSISLSSENDFINTLLYINRAYNNKSFIEFIMPNEIQFNENMEFIYKIIKYILDKNYFFIIENKITDFPSSIKFMIKIYKERPNEIIIKKEFQLFEKNNKNNNKISYNFFNEINYNFKLSDYFIFDFDSFNHLLKNYKNINLNIYNNLLTFLYDIIEQNKKIKIVTVLSKNIFDDKQMKQRIKKYMEIIELNDIIFSFKDDLNRFFLTYNSIYKRSSNNSSIYDQKYKSYINEAKDLILYDKDKYRKNYPRITILFNEFDYISIYIQNGLYMELDYIEIFFLNDVSKKCKNISEYNHYYYFFIGGFLSRFIYDKPFKVCCSAGQLLLNKILESNSINYINVDDYNICVPNKKKYIRQYSYKKFDRLPSKEYIKRNVTLSQEKQEKNKAKANIILRDKDNDKDNNNFYRNDLTNLKNRDFSCRHDLIIKEPNTEMTTLSLKRKLYFFKTSKNYNFKSNRNNSMTNVFNKNIIKKQSIKKDNKYRILKNFSMPFFDINDEKLKIKKTIKRPHSNYFRTKDKNKYKLNINNNNRIFNKYNYYYK